MSGFSTNLDEAFSQLFFHRGDAEDRLRIEKMIVRIAIREFLEKKQKERPQATKHHGYDTDEDGKMIITTFYLGETVKEAITRWKKELEEGE